MENKPLACPAIWFSGFFGFGAFVHLVRLILKFPVTIGSFAVPLRMSLMAAVVLGALSVVLLILGCKKPCCDKK